MKFLIDQGLPRSAVGHLASLGVAAEHVSGRGLFTATDEAILADAVVREEVVVTLDADFHQILAASGATKPSVIRIRIEGLKGDQLAALLAQVIDATSAELTAGAVVSVTETHVRVRRLPIGG